MFRLVVDDFLVAVQRQVVTLGHYLILGHRERLLGAGSAVLGLLQFLLGGIASPLSGLGGDSTAVPMAVGMLIFSGLALSAAVSALRLTRRAVSD